MDHVDLIKGAEKRMEKVIEKAKDRLDRLRGIFSKGKGKPKKPAKAIN